jgi:hypothetical protein
MSFPVRITPKWDLDWVLRNASTKPYLGVNNMGQLSPIANTGAQYMAWKAAAKPAITANSWVQVLPQVTPTAPGKCLYVQKILIDCTDDSFWGIANNRLASTFALSAQTTIGQQVGSFMNRTKDQPVATGGQVVFDFGWPGMKVPYGDKFGVYYSRTVATGTNYNISIEALEISNYFNFDAALMQGYMGDSFCGVAEVGALEFAYRNGNIHGTWPGIVTRHLRKNGIDVYPSNIGEGGTNSTYWEFRCANGLFNTWKPDLLHCSLGMNDGASLGFISTVPGTDGIFKTAYKNIIRYYFEAVKKGCFVANQVTDTTSVAQMTPIVGGMYNGKTQVQAIREELIALIAELQAQHPEWDLHLADTSPASTYLSNQAVNFVEPADPKTHPTCDAGQPKIAVKVIEKTVQTLFYQRYLPPAA